MMNQQKSFKTNITTAFENIKRSLRTQIIILTLIGWGVAMSIDRTVVDDYRVKSDNLNRDNLPEMVRNHSDKVALSILSVFETLLFGLGIGFFVAVGLKVFKIRNQQLRKRMIWCWGCISFFMVSWWPHSTSHALILTSKGDIYDNLIAIEVSFHWTILFCSLTLSYFQYDLILLMFEVAMMKKKMETRKECNPLKMDWKYNFKYHGILLLCVFFGVGMVFMFHYDPLKPEYKRYQKFFYVTFKMVDSIILGCGFAFSYIAVRIISLLPPSNGKKVAIISSLCIAALFFIGYGHPMAHTHSPYSMESTVIIDYTIHLPIIILTTVLAFYQFRMLELSTDSSSSICMAAKLRNRPHKYSFPIRSLGIKSQAVTNIGQTMGHGVGVSGSESKYTGTPECDGSSAITTDEKLQIQSQRPTQPYYEEEHELQVKKEKSKDNEIEMEPVKNNFQTSQPSSNNQFSSVDISIDQNGISVVDITNKVDTTIDVVEIDIQHGVAGGGDVPISSENNINNNINSNNNNEEPNAEEEVIPTEDTIDEFMHEI
ncbi:hypothetical protein DDB_G0289519 [Dictyostelium discoideum AX4]|uniref:Uncharacterized protein n=1 Tax=Dictyostelium discoideum TaxID=44689 RepID=Q54HD8_DICDI|nr:hypothetical protein DDB_G0289519 [Dictyostelium discoideum AX4]EAL62691.1 hypothetical protein DDB_G0289519 [Dictyostelium discoideum AX4]|eukprot:XP_636200.1 hypothetical protein DDB_G0289519 [Dictyostelium discoideum AX4]